MVRLVPIFLSLVFCAAARAQDPATEMDAYIESQVKARTFMGSVRVAREDHLVLTKGYGMASLELDVPNTPRTKFRLGSITKQFVAAAILQLEEQGKLRVEDPVSKYIPDSPPAWNGITLHHLLSHTSGIPNFTSFPDYSKTWSLPSRPDQTILRYKNKPLDFQPGQKWSYSNSGYVLLGYLLEKISGEKYEDYLRRHIFEPAGMTDSGHDTHEEVLKNRASGYSRGRGETWVNSAYHDMSIPIGGGDLYSTVEDLQKWDQALRTEKILSRKSLDKMFTPVMNRYAYGWLVDRQYGRVRQSHGGGINGFATFFARFPDERAVVAVLGNMDFANSAEVASNLVRILFGEKATRPQDRKAITMDSAKLADYVGQYEVAPGVRAVIGIENGKLMAAIPGVAREEILPEATDSFFFKSTDRVLTFHRGEGGAIHRVVMHRFGTETDMKKISSEVPPAPKELKLSPEDLAELAGEYELTPSFSIVVTTEGGKLYGQATGQSRFEMFAEAKDKFFLTVVDARIDFERGADGKVTQLTLHQSGQHLPMRRK